MARASEKDLDRALEAAFEKSPRFVNWFLSHTKFRAENAAYHWSRSDHPWSRVEVTLRDPITAQETQITRESETDVLVVFKSNSGKIFALHIENKLSAGKFEPLQPEQYAPRAEQWKGDPKYSNYSDYQTVLVAPTEFRDRYSADAAKFDCYIAHEDIADYIPEFNS